MNSMGLTKLVLQATMHSELAAKAIELGQMEVAQDHMKALSEKYKAFCAESADEAPEEQQDDAEKKERHKEKGCVVDSPHDGYVPGS